MYATEEQGDETNGAEIESRNFRSNRYGRSEIYFSAGEPSVV
jgi:hypothetical protein